MRTYITNGARKSERKFGDAHFEHTFIRMKQVKEIEAGIEHSDGIGKSCLNIGFRAMIDFLGIAHNSQQRKGRFDDHAVIPSTLFADFHVVWHTASATKAPISQHNGLLVIFRKEIQEILIRIVHLVPNPAAHLPEAIENPAQFNAYAPASFITAFRAKLFFRTTCSDGKN